jgi:hypothetical protein
MLVLEKFLDAFLEQYYGIKTVVTHAPAFTPSSRKRLSND